MQLRLATHAILTKFFGTSINDVRFIEKPTISSIKWLAVPRLHANSNIISEQDLKTQITSLGLLSHANIISGPSWIIAGKSNGRIAAMVKLDIEDTHAGDNLKALINKTVFINGKSCRMLPWTNKASIPQCASCLRWGHSTGGCLSNTTYCAICSQAHLTSQHNLMVQRKMIDESINIPTCINCLAAGLLHNHMATAKDCPFFVERK